MLFLGMVWLVLFALEMVGNLTPALERVGYLIWGLFIIDFLARFSLSPRKSTFLKNNWLSIISLVAPAFRIFRLFTILRAAQSVGFLRGLRLLRLLTTVNRGMKALGATMKRRGFGYVVLVTVMVTIAGAAAMYSFEQSGRVGEGFETFGTALWWTAMIMTTMGSQYWPHTAEGRILCFLLSLYSFSVFGYMTATLASFFIGRDAENEEAEIASAKAIEKLQREVAALTAELRAHQSKSKEQVPEVTEKEP